jgi:hypothetical protein
MPLHDGLAGTAIAPPHGSSGKSFGAIGRITTTIFFFSASYCGLSEDNSISLP